jgi:hypothetical protein
MAVKLKKFVLEGDILELRAHHSDIAKDVLYDVGFARNAQTDTLTYEDLMDFGRRIHDDWWELLSTYMDGRGIDNTLIARIENDWEEAREEAREETVEETVEETGEETGEEATEDGVQLPAVP